MFVNLFLRGKIIFNLIILIIFTLTILSTFQGCQYNDSTTKNSQLFDTNKLYTFKTDYVGNSSKVSGILNNINFSEYKVWISLQTENEPYEITVNYDFKQDLETNSLEKKLRNNSLILFTLIKNVDIIKYSVANLSIDNEYIFTRNELQKDFSLDLRKNSDTEEKFNNFINTLKQ